MDYRKKVLEEFLNDEVTPERVKVGIYSWRGRFYQVIPYKQIFNLKSRPDAFIRVKHQKTNYGIREMSESLLKKWFGNEIGAKVPGMTRRKFRLEKQSIDI